MKIAFYFRRKNRNAFSIEKLFSIIIEHLPVDIQPNNFNVPHYSSGILSIIKNALSTIKHQQEINHITGDIHYVALFLKKSKTILTIHDLLMLEKGGLIKKLIFKNLWFSIPVKRVKYVTVISEATKKELLEKIEIDPEKIIVIPNCVDPSFKPVAKKFNEEIPNILVIGTKENKNVERIIEAVSGLCCKLKIVGVLPEYLIEKLEEKDVQFENKWNLNDSEVRDWYIDSDLLLFVSLKEGFGVPILEAQAIGRPVITSNLSSMPEVANDGALLVNPYDVQEIRSAVVTLIANEPLRKELIEKGFENVKKYKPENIATRYYELYKSLRKN